MSAGSRVPRSPRRRAATLAALGLVVALPVGAVVTAPSARADVTGQGAPGSALAGINASASGTGFRVVPYTPGIVGAGDVSQGDLFEVAVPYASASTTTGPSHSAVSSPVYPGATAAGAGNALGTFAPQFPPQLLELLNYPALAQADFPAQRAIGPSGSYSPPGGSAAGVGTAQASAGPGGASSSAAASSTAIQAVFTVDSSTAHAKTVLGADRVTSSATSDIGAVSLLGGAIRISGITSEASALSDGKSGTGNSTLHVGSVTVAGQSASIGPNGIQVGPASQGSGLFPAANQALVALQQAGISVHTVAPVTTYDGASATVTSGGVQIVFEDQHIPNPNGQVPVSSVGLEFDLGFSQASADATPLPPFQGFGAGSFGSAGGSSSAPLVGAAPSGATPAVGPSSGAVPAAPVASGGVATAGTATAAPQTGSAPPAAAPLNLGPVSPVVLGLPVKAVWIIIAFLLSLVAAGPLLAYANWQLLRGRRT